MALWSSLDGQVAAVGKMQVSRSEADGLHWERLRVWVAMFQALEHSL